MSNIAVAEGKQWLQPGLFICALTLYIYKKRARKCSNRGTSTERYARNLSKKQVLELRYKYFCRAQSISYENSTPLFAKKAKGQYIYDECGNAYLDTRNNVGHVGWQNPVVSHAIQRQLHQLNTNTRYIHHLRVALAKKLVETLPKNLCQVFFVNSGSEANDLALRLARTHTGKSDVIVVDHAYHGHTVATIQISPYKYEHVGGPGQSTHTHKVPCPDTYRGIYTGSNAAEKYASHVKRACEDVDVHRGLAAFFVESGMSVGGVIIPPKEYLKLSFDYVRKHGGVCIADEVQVGFGRVGKCYWGFQLSGVVPDIVTVGKPFGNGFPLAAVVTTRAISDSFANGLEYFNTFGGNPIACAAGIAVLDVIEDMNLQQHALRVGTFIKHALQMLAAKAVGKAIGNVRGEGLFIGIEFVRNRESRIPATKLTSLICSRLKERHKILTSIDGPDHNVLVLKPPMCFTVANAKYFMEKLELELGQVSFGSSIENYSHTST